jgi:hypothetical protein
MYLNQEHCCMDVYVKAFQFFLITSKNGCIIKKIENHTLKNSSQIVPGDHHSNLSANQPFVHFTCRSLS